MIDIPYHYFISTTGTIAEGRELKYSAQTNTPDSEYGKRIPQHLTVLLERVIVRGPNNKPLYDERDELRYYYPLEQVQKDVLERLLGELASKHKIPSDRIAWHSHYASTSCPGTQIINAVEAIKAKLKKRGL